MTSSSTQPLSDDGTSNKQMEKIKSTAESRSMDKPPKENWLVALIQTQIKTFNPLLLLLAIKSVFGMHSANEKRLFTADNIPRNVPSGLSC
jgi:hypothetical protein